MNEDFHFKVGDLVQLRSGGPTMVISRVMPGGVECVWFRAEEAMRADFQFLVLEFAKSKTQAKQYLS